MRRLSFPPCKPTNKAEICGDDESAQKLRRTNVKIPTRETPYGETRRNSLSGPGPAGSGARVHGMCEPAWALEGRAGRGAW